jgi:hypothetical protein
VGNNIIQHLCRDLHISRDPGRYSVVRCFLQVYAREAMVQTRTQQTPCPLSQQGEFRTHGQVGNVIDSEWPGKGHYHYRTTYKGAEIVENYHAKSHNDYIDPGNFIRTVSIFASMRS